MSVDSFILSKDEPIGTESYTLFPIYTIFRLASILLATSLLDGLLNYSSTLKMEGILSSETSGATQRTTRRHIPEDNTLLGKSRSWHI
jgi:hypothetical protein